MYNIRYEDIKWNFDFCTKSIVKQIEELSEGTMTIDFADDIEKLRLYTYKLWKSNMITVKEFVNITERIFNKIRLREIVEDEDDLPF